jgi:hypothetical protein
MTREKVFTPRCERAVDDRRGKTAGEISLPLRTNLGPLSVSIPIDVPSWFQTHAGL